MCWSSAADSNTGFKFSEKYICTLPEKAVTYRHPHLNV